MTTELKQSGLTRGELSVILGTPGPLVFLHGDFQPGLGLLPKEIKAFYEKHGRVMILTGPVMVNPTVKSLQRMGVPAVGMTARLTIKERVDAIDAFNASEAGVLVVSAHWTHGYKVDAKCIVMTGLHMPGLFKNVSEVATRAVSPPEIHFIDCHWPMDKPKKMFDFFEPIISTLNRVPL